MRLRVYLAVLHGVRLSYVESYINRTLLCISVSQAQGLAPDVAKLCNFVQSNDSLFAEDTEYAVKNIKKALRQEASRCGMAVNFD